MQKHFKTNLFYKYSIESVPRILSNMNRNPLSSSYGCMNRDYWMYKTSDFSDAIRQFPTYALSIIYKENLEFLIMKKNLLDISSKFRFYFLFNIKMDHLMNFI